MSNWLTKIFGGCSCCHCKQCGKECDCGAKKDDAGNSQKEENKPAEDAGKVQ